MDPDPSLESGIKTADRGPQYRHTVEAEEVGKTQMAIAEPRDETRIGVSRPRPDSREKVTGLIHFEADRPHMGLLHARLVPSLYAHSRLPGVGAPEALALPGGVAVLTAGDLPIKPRDDM